VDDDDALQAAEIIKRGKKVQVEINVNGIPVLIGTTEYYRSVKQAYNECKALRDICERNGNCSCEQLLKAMHRVDASLVRRALRIKHTLTDAHKHDRRVAARWLQDKLRTDPTFLDNVVFIDEATIYLVGNMTNHNLHVWCVWCDKNDKQFHDVVHCPGLGKDRKVKLHFIAAVSKKHGPLYFNWTTCTKFDGFQRMPWVAANGNALLSVNFPTTFMVSLVCYVHGWWAVHGSACRAF
jgi:hypothetical protein